MPWTFAGLTAGSWQLSDPLAPSYAPDPGMAEAQVPLAWYDSAAVVVGEDAAWNGWGAGLVSARGFVRAPGGSKPRAMFSLVSGGNGLDRNGIFVSRGDERSWVRLGATGNRRGGMGDLDVAGDHLWTLGTGGGGDRIRWDAGFTQRGMGESQRSGGLAESGHGQDGHASLHALLGRDSLDLTLTRGFEGRLLSPVGAEFIPVWRDAEQSGADIQLWRRDRIRRVGLRLQVKDARVVDFVRGPAAATIPRFEWSTRSVWLSGSAQQAFAGGELELQLGAGSDRSAGRSPLVPGATWRLRRDDRWLRLFLERAYVPVWSELETGVAPFRQDTWTTGMESGAGHDRGASGSMLVLLGRTGARATLVRYPLRSENVAVGWRRDGPAYRFLMMQGSAALRGPVFGVDATGYALARPRGGSQSRVDPGVGAKAGLESRFALFTGDLGVHLRVEAAYVGSRMSDTRATEDELLPGYGMLGVSMAAKLGDATIEVRGEHLAAERQPEPWLEAATGVLARDAGPQWRTSVTWPLFN